MLGGYFDQADIGALRLVERKPGLVFSQSELGTIGPRLIASLKRYAKAQPAKSARICMHESEDNRIHEMLIAAARHTIWPPHRNEFGAKSWLAFDGSVVVVLYGENRECEGHLRLEADNPQGFKFLRLSAGKWHTILPVSEYAVYLETALGPYRKTTFADWGPQMYGDRESARLIERIERE